MKNITLSRALKLVERINRESDTVFDKMASIGAPVVVQVSEDKTPLESLSQFNTLLGLSEKLNTASLLVRQAIAVKNAEIGLHEKMASRAVLQRQIKSISELLHGLTHDKRAVSQEHLEGYMKRLSDAGTFQLVSVKVVDEATMTKLNNSLKAMMLQSDRFGDEIAEMNGQNKISIALDEEIAEMIGL